MCSMGWQTHGMVAQVARAKGWCTQRRHSCGTLTHDPHCSRRWLEHHTSIRLSILATYIFSKSPLFMAIMRLLRSAAGLGAQVSRAARVCQLPASSTPRESVHEERDQCPGRCCVWVAVSAQCSGSPITLSVPAPLALRLRARSWPRPWLARWAAPCTWWAAR